MSQEQLVAFLKQVETKAKTIPVESPEDKKGGLQLDRNRNQGLINRSQFRLCG